LTRYYPEEHHPTFSRHSNYIFITLVKQVRSAEVEKEMFCSFSYCNKYHKKLLNLFTHILIFMQKIILFIAFVLSFAISYAQVQFGLKGGLNLATVKYINADNSKARLGWNAGLLAEVPVQEGLLVRPEVLYSRRFWIFRYGNKQRRKC
jgi:hypothetical protein